MQTIEIVLQNLKDESKIKGFQIIAEGDQDSPFDKPTGDYLFAIDSVMNNYAYLYSRGRAQIVRDAGDPYYYKTTFPYSLLVVITKPNLFTKAKIQEVASAFMTILLGANVLVRNVTADMDSIANIRNEAKRVEATIDNSLKFTTVRVVRIDFTTEDSVSINKCKKFDFCDC